jgi:hypothetical protein
MVELYLGISIFNLFLDKSLTPAFIESNQFPYKTGDTSLQHKHQYNTIKDKTKHSPYNELQIISTSRGVAVN